MTRAVRKPKAPRRLPSSDDVPAIVGVCRASAYDGLTALGRVEHHLGCLRDFESEASARVRTVDRGTDDNDTAPTCQRLMTRIEGHAVRALVALLEWVNEEAAREQSEAGADAGQAHADRAALVQADPDGDRAGAGRVLPAAVDAAVDEAAAAYREQRNEEMRERRDYAALTSHRVVTSRGAEMHECDWQTLAALLVARGERVDAIITDCPYSERTHAGHDGGAAQANGADDRWTRSNGRVEAKRERREIDYAQWTPADVSTFVDAWHPLCAGWIVSLTDDGLFPHWRASMDAAKRQTFQDIPCVIRGMSVRLVGDGPSSWAIHAAVSRPRTKAMAKWGTLDGAYVGPSERQPVVGGKPLWLMRALVRDYSRPGDLVCDPCFGGGTTALACALEGRRFIGAEPLASHFDIGVSRLAEAPQDSLDGQGRTQLGLLARSA